MTLIEAIHTAARRYCMDRADFWQRAYAELNRCSGGRTRLPDGGWDYSDEAKDIFPRYNVLGAILEEVERFEPADFATMDAAREMLALAGETAAGDFTKSKGAIERAAMADERARYAEYVLGLSAADLARVAPLYFRRVLGEREHDDLHRAVSVRWGTWDGGKCDRSDLPPHLTLRASSFYDDLDGFRGKLRNLLSDRSLRRVWELREWGSGYEIDVEVAGFTYNGAEGFWTAGEMDWLIYASHEDSVTFGGEWLAGEARRLWPDWHDRVYTGWMPCGRAP